MSLYAVIGSGIREVPRREMNGVFSKAFPLINWKFINGVRIHKSDSIHDWCH